MNMKPFAASIRNVKTMGKTFYRVVVAHSNMAAYNMQTEEMCQSWHPKYRVGESGDYVVMPSIKEARALALQVTRFRAITPAMIDWM